MTLKWLLASLHLLALGVGMGAIWSRARWLRAPLEPAALRRVFAADAWWGIAALVWISTGLARLLMVTEKPIAYYMNSGAFVTKMALLGLVLALEVWPMATLIRWRIASGRGVPVATERAGAFATISTVQLLLVIGMVLAATAMARGLGA